MTNQTHETTKYYLTYAEYKTAVANGERNVAYDASHPGTQQPALAMCTEESSAWSSGCGWRENYNASK